MNRHDSVQVPTQKPALLVPRHIRNLNALAERHGLSTRSYVDEYEDKPGQFCLAVDWTGTADQLFATTLLQPSQQRRFQLTCGSIAVSVPMDVGWYQKALLEGRVKIDDRRGVTVELDFDEVPNEISENAGVEISTCSAGTWYHGTAEALVVAGIDQKKIPTGKRASRCAGHRAQLWTCRRQPDGLFTYWQESESSWAARDTAHKEEAKHFDKQSGMSPEQQREFDRGYAMSRARTRVCRSILDGSETDLAVLRDLLHFADKRRDARAILDRDLSVKETVELLRRPVLTLLRGGAA